jgi:hypothetical protein
MHKDATGKYLFVGDKVVYPDSYGDLKVGEVERFTPQFVVIVCSGGGHERKVPSKVAKVA